MIIFAPTIWQTYRLIALVSTTPEELYSRKIAAEEYGEAIMLAQHYRYTHHRSKMTHILIDQSLIKPASGNLRLGELKIVKVLNEFLFK